MEDKQSLVMKGVLGFTALALLGGALYYLSLEDEFEDMKQELEGLGQTLGKFSLEDMHAYMDKD